MAIHAPPRDPQMSKLLGWFFILLALPLGFFALTNSVNKLTAESWPRAQAEVLSSDLYRPSRSNRWCLRLRYRYVIDGKEYSSRRLSPSVMGGASSCAREKMVIEARLEKLQPGARIRIHYHPSNPAKAAVYLDDLDFTDYLLSGLTVLLLAGGIACIREGAAMARQQQAWPSRTVESSTDRAPRPH